MGPGAAAAFAAEGGRGALALLTNTHHEGPLIDGRQEGGPGPFALLTNTHQRVMLGKCGVPWLALGGVDSTDRAAECAAAGASGIAVLGAVMRSPEPERVAAELAAAFAEEARCV